MLQRRIPEWLRHAPVPSVQNFAALGGLEALTRGILISVYPLTMYAAFGDAKSVSALYFFVGIISLLVGLAVPPLTRLIARRWMYTLGVFLFPVGAILAMTGHKYALAAGLLCNTVATVTAFICINAYLLDHIGKRELGRSETLRLLYSALSWTVGPAGGVWLMLWWRPAPFIVSGVAALAMLALFWSMRMGNGKVISRAKGPAPNPLAYLGRFFQQPRLIAGWLFAVIRSAGWWVYVVYVPIFAVQSGLGEQIGSLTLSFSNGMLFLAPLMMKFVQHNSIRFALRTGFLSSGLAFVLSGVISGYPIGAIGVLMLASMFLILLDVCAGLPFLMAVHPSERTEMSAIYASYRDVSGILTPGFAWIVLLFAPLAGVFVAGGLGLGIGWYLSRRVHPRLGAARGGVALRQASSV
ncbi:MAG: MFS transporter [Rhodobacterales bacterium]|jgi:MFS transporter, ACDE family, multidrug resistance protein|nr:MFS transporter [Rhodobacter sp.]